MKRISVVVPCKDGAHIPRLRKELAGQTLKPSEIIFEIGKPPAVARNLGARRSKGDWIAFIDDDVRLHPGWLKELAENARKDSIVMGSVSYWPFGKQEHGETCNCIVHRSKFIEFDERFRKPAFEDKDWFIRSGGVMVVPAAVVHHKSRHRSSFRNAFAFGVERVRFGRKHGRSLKRPVIDNGKQMLVPLANILGIIYGWLKNVK